MVRARHGPDRSVPPSLPFDRVADLYDETRGGEERGRRFAAELHEVLDPTVLTLEVGVGTGVVAKGLVALGHRVVGVDLSEPMARSARDRVGPRVALGDATRLPVRSRDLGQVYAVWVLHVVGDQLGMLREVERVLAPGGRFVVLPALGPRPSDPLGSLVWDMDRRLDPGGRRHDDPDHLERLAPRAGLRVLAARPLTAVGYLEAPADVVRKLELRSYSSLWTVDDVRWKEIVEPTLAAVRALPDQGTPIQRFAHNSLVILERTEP